MSKLVGASNMLGGSAIGVGRDDERCAQLVIETYTRAPKTGGQNAFEVAVKIWREQNPDASPETARTAVATILCYKL